MAEHERDAIARLERQMADLEASVRAQLGGLADVIGAAATAEYAKDLAHKLDGELSGMAARLRRLEKGGRAEEPKEPRYEFAPPVRWHELDAAGRAEVVARVREWVDTVYREQFPRAAGLAPCWEAHPVCVVLFDVLSEMHRALCHGSKRTLTSVHNQAEMFIRIGREITALVHEELGGCRYGQHVPPGGGGRG